MLSNIAPELPNVRFRTERLQTTAHSDFTFRFRPAWSNPTPAAPIGLILLTRHAERLPDAVEPSSLKRRTSH